MSLKQDLETNIKAVKAYDAQDYELALDQFELIADTSSKIYFNMGLIYATIGEHEIAVEHFQNALRMDQYLAVSYFQQGVSNFLLGRFGLALENFNNALLYLRGNKTIDYTQLGLKFLLHSCEVLFNRGLSSIYLGDKSKGLKDFTYAATEKQNSEHDVIDEALRNKGVGYTVFSIPVGTLYRPDEAKVRNIAARDYLGKARLIASTDSGDTGTGFRGREKASISEAESAIGSMTREGPTSSIRDSIGPMPTSAYVYSMSKDKAMGRDRKPSLPGLDFELERRPSNASMTSVRSRFPAPTRTNSARERRTPQLPPTPPPDVRSRQGSDTSSVASEIQSNASSRSGVARSQTTNPNSFRPRMPELIQRRNTERTLRVGRKNSDESVYEDKSPSPGIFANYTFGARSTGSEIHQSKDKSSLPSPEDYQDLVDDYYTMPASIVTKVKCKVYGLEEIRMITLEADCSLSSFHCRLLEKTGWKSIPKLLIKDEDGEMILLHDQEDLDHLLELAIANARKLDLDVGRTDVFVKGYKK